MKTCHVCPVCQGKGLVVAGFYEPLSNGLMTIGAVVTTELCRTCDGKGIVWENPEDSHLTYDIQGTSTTDGKF